MNLFIAIAAGVGVTYLGLLFLIWRFQERVVFQPPRVASRAPEQGRRVSFRTVDELELSAHVVGEYSSGTPVLLAFHGNAHLAHWLLPWAATLARAANVCVVLPEYRGYDDLPGDPSYVGSGLDALAALKFVRESMRVPQEDISYFGHSLGSAIAAELAAAHPPRSLILQAPFSSANDMSRRYLFIAPSFLLTRIARVHFNTVARVTELSRPVWVAHGARDVIIPERMGRAVFDAARVKGELLLLPTAGHNDVADVGGAAYWAWFARAIASGGDRKPIPAVRAGIRSAL